MKFTTTLLKLVATPIVFFVLANNLLAQNPTKVRTTNVELLGEVRQGIYHNSVYGFEFAVPGGWFVASADDVDSIKKYAREGLTDYKISRTGIESNSQTESISLMISKDKIGKARNPVLGFSVTKQANSKVTADMLAEATKPVFVGKNGTSLEKDVTSETIGGHTFATFDLLVVSSVGKQYVRVFITMIKEDAITFALTYFDDADRKLMESSIRSIRFSGQ